MDDGSHESSSPMISNEASDSKPPHIEVRNAGFGSRPNQMAADDDDGSGSPISWPSRAEPAPNK